MSILNVIDKTIVEAPDFTERSSNIKLNIALSTGENIEFDAEKQFFTPRVIATSRADVLGLPPEQVVEYTATDIPVVKLAIGATAVDTPQFYALSTQSDVYKQIDIDNFFVELADDLSIPDDDPEITTLREQRDASMQAALALDDLTAAADIGDIDGFDIANEEIDEGLAESIDAPEADPTEVLTAEEADELGALDLVGLTEDTGTDAAEDTIENLPEVLDENVIQRLPLVPGKIKGTEKINQAISLLNDGIETVEGSLKQGVDEEGKCKFITIAKKKKGFLGIGKRKERKVSRAETENRLKLVKEDIEAQKSSAATITQTKSGIRTYIPIVKSTVFGKLFNGLSKAGFLGAIAGIIGAPFTGGASLVLAVGGVASSVAAVGVGIVGAATGARTAVPKGHKPMSKQQALRILEAVRDRLEKILQKDCD